MCVPWGILHAGLPQDFCRKCHPGREICHQCICDGHKAWAFGNPWWCGDPRSGAERFSGLLKNDDESWYTSIQPDNQAGAHSDITILTHWNLIRCIFKSYYSPVDKHDAARYSDTRPNQDLWIYESIVRRCQERLASIVPFNTLIWWLPFYTLSVGISDVKDWFHVVVSRHPFIQ